MSGFFSEIIDSVSSSRRGGSEQVYESESYGYNDHQAPPPGCPYPWRAIWHEQDRRYYYVNQETNETVWEFDEVQRRAGGGRVYEQDSTTYYDQRSAGGYGGSCSGYRTEEVVEEKRGGGGHGMLYGGLGAAAGLVADNDYEEDKYRFEEDKYRVENDVENFPENAAGWTGEKVGEVEGGFDRFGNSVEQKWDNAEYDVENAPEEAAGWFGQKVGDVERFDDSVKYNYDQGKFDGRNDYDDY